MAKKRTRNLRSRSRLLFDSLEVRILLSTTVAVSANTADQTVSSTGAFDYVANTTVRIGDAGNGASEVSYIIPFMLPTGTGVNSASFQVVLNSVANQSSVTGNVDIYGLGFRPFSAVQSTDYFEGAYNTDTTDATPIENAIFTHTSTPGTYTTSVAANTALANYLTAQYAAGATAGDYVFLRLNAESDQLTSRYWVADSGDMTGGLAPLLTITYNSNLPPPDTTPPAINITSPASGAMISGTPPAALTVTGVAGIASGDLPTVTLKIYSGTAATGAPLQTLTTTANSSTGACSFVTPNLPQGQFTLQASQSDNAGNIGTSTTTYSTYNTLAGDANGDGTVNFADFVIVSNNFGLTNTNAGPSVGDFNYDHVVDFADFVIVSNSFGQIFVPAPTNFSLVTSSASTLNLSWTDNATNETAYLVDRSTDGVNYTNVATLAANTTAWQDIDRSPDTTYYYRLRATDNGTDSAIASASDSTIPAFYQTLWVDGTHGLDSNNGAFATPFKTITAALNSSAVKGHPAGTGIIVRAGTYTESNKSLIMPSGTSGSPFTLMGEPTERAIISGFKQLTGWSLYSGNIYSTTINWSPDTLYINDTPETISRSPDSSWWTIPSTFTQNSDGTSTISDPAHLAGIGNVVGGYMQEFSTATNIPYSSKILSQNTVTGSITFAGNSAVATGQFYSLTDALSLINNPGEWASVDNGNGTYTVYFQPSSVSDLSYTQARNTAGRNIQITGSAHDITIRGLEITGSAGWGIDIEGAQGNLGSTVIVRNDVIHNNGKEGIWIRFETNISVQNNTLYANLNGIGIASTTNSLVDSNDIGFNVTDGIDLTGDWRGPGVAGFTPTSNVTISNNYIHDHLGWGHADGIQIFSWVDAATITGNFVYNNGQGLMSENVDDSVTNNVADSNWSTLSNNIFLDSGAFTVIFGHSNSFNWNVTNNTIGGAGYGPFSFTATGYHVSQNIIIGTEGMISASANQYVGDYNFYYSPTSQYFLATSSPTYVNYNALVNAGHTGFYDTQGQDQHSKFSALGASGPPPLATSPFVNGPSFGTMLSASKWQVCTTTLLYLNSVTSMAVGDYIQIDGDGIVRRITAVDTVNKTITIDTPLSALPRSPSLLVEDWSTRSNFTLNLAATGVAATMGPTGNAVGSAINIQNMISGDYNGDGLRDYPALPLDVLVGLPNPIGWPAPNFSVIGP